MWWYILLIPRLLLALFGLYLIVLRLAGTDEAQDKAHGYLEKAWTRINELQKQALSRHTSFMRVIAGSVNSLFNRIFGEKLISLQSLAVSTCYAFATLFLTIFLLSLWAKNEWDNSELFNFFLLLILGSFPILFSSNKDKIQQDKFRAIWLTAISTAAYLNVVNPVLKATWALLQVSETRFFGRFLIIIIIAVLCAVALYTIFVMLFRFSIRKISASTSFIKIVIISLINTVPVAIFYLLLKLLDIRFDYTNWDDSAIKEQMKTAEGINNLVSNWGFQLETFITLLLITVFLFDILFLATAVLSLVLSLLMVIHRILWPVIQKFVFGLHKNQVIKTGKFLPIIGVLLILIALGQYTWIGKIISKFID